MDETMEEAMDRIEELKEEIDAKIQREENILEFKKQKVKRKKRELKSPSKR